MKILLFLACDTIYLLQINSLFKPFYKKRFGSVQLIIPILNQSQIQNKNGNYYLNLGIIIWLKWNIYLICYACFNWCLVQLQNHMTIVQN